MYGLEVLGDPNSGAATLYVSETGSIAAMSAGDVARPEKR